MYVDMSRNKISCINSPLAQYPLLSKQLFLFFAPNCATIFIGLVSPEEINHKFYSKFLAITTNIKLYKYSAADCELVVSPNNIPS